jgi:hypothetical protein
LSISLAKAWMVFVLTLDYSNKASRSWFQVVQQKWNFSLKWKKN